MKRTKQSRPTRRIVRLSEDCQDNHRGDFKTCPHCDHEMNSDEWDKAAVELVLEPRCYKSGSVSIFSECPKCFEKSWVHHRMVMFDCNEAWPSEWIEEVKKEDARVRLIALREWGQCLCHKCKHLTDGTVEYHAWRGCIVGSGPAERTCDKFEPLAAEKVTRGNQHAS